MFTDAHAYENRSEAVRDLVRSGLEKARIEAGEPGNCVATLSYVLNGDNRPTDNRHECQDLQVLTTRVPLDHERSLEVAVLRGSIVAVRDHAKTIIAKRGVAYGNVSFVPIESFTTASAGTVTSMPPDKGIIEKAVRGNK